MDTSRLVTCIQKELSERKGLSSLLLQNHLYGCFIVMEDIAQGILEVTDEYLSGNALYLNLEKQFGQIGIRYYGFVMDGRAILEDAPVEYKEGWLKIFRSCKSIDCKGDSIVDHLEDEIIRLLETVKEDNYFMNAMEHDGSLTPDWIERAIHTLHPHLERVIMPPMLQEKAEKGTGEQEKKAERQERQEKKARHRNLATTRRAVVHRPASHTRWSTTRRQHVSKQK